MKHQNLFCVVVVNWNNASDTLGCLDSLQKAGRKDMRVLVVDNGSTDDSPEAIEQAFPQYEILRLAENRGFGAGCNAGVEHVGRGGAEFVIFLNNDTLVDQGFPGPLIEGLQQNPAAAITVPKICYMHEPEVVWYGGGIADLLSGQIRHRGIREPDGPAFSVSEETGYATGCCMALRLADFSALGGFDESFGMYGEDVDLSLRARRSGKVILYVPSSTILHRVSSSLGGELGFRKQWRKHKALLRLFVRYRAWKGGLCFLGGIPLYFLKGLVSVVRFRRDVIDGSER